MHSSTERHGCWATNSSPEVSRWQRATIFWGRPATRMPGSRRSTACAAGRGGPAEGRQAGGRAAGGQAGRQAGGRPDELEDVNYGRAIQGLGQAGRGSRRQGGRREDGRREDERRGQTAVEEGQAASRELEACRAKMQAAMAEEGVQLDTTQQAADGHEERARTQRGRARGEEVSASEHTFVCSRCVPVVCRTSCPKRAGCRVCSARPGESGVRTWRLSSQSHTQ